MQYVLVISKMPLTEDCVAQTAAAVGASLFAGLDGTFHFDMDAPTLRLRIEPWGNEFTDWEDEPDRLSRIKSLGSQACAYFVHYKSIERLREVLCGLASCAEYILDDDYDLFVNGSEFVSLCQENRDSNSWWLGGHHDVRY